MESEGFLPKKLIELVSFADTPQEVITELNSML